MALQEVLQHTNSDKKEASLYNYISWSELFPAGKNIDVAALINYKVGDIVVARDSMNDPILVDLALHAIHAGCRVIDEIEFYGHIFERVPIDQVSRAWLLAEGLDHRRRVFTDLIKRSFDVVAAFLGIIVCSPVLLLIALIIRLTSQGPVIFVQPRVGQFCQPFNMYKFRTMYIPKTGGDHSKDGFTAVNDPRVTAIGKIIRPLHFDELPQLFNILLGHMSIVGPRPETLNFATKVRKQIDLYDMRYLMRPGLTGHAQLHQGYAMDTVDDTKKKVSFDLYYLCKHSLTWDLRLILRTVFVLVRGAR
jgi:lipopolysaccharide/colanic/teichoic acid biosynthesis glycosyltransferase